MEYPKIRNLDGVFYHVERNGKQIKICYSDMTSEERNKCTENYSIEQMKFLAERMADALHQLGDYLEVVAGYPEGQYDNN